MRFCSSDDICSDMGVPRVWCFKYLQLCHAAWAQFGGGEVSLVNTKLESVLLDPDHSKLISFM